MMPGTHCGKQIKLSKTMGVPIIHYGKNITKTRSCNIQNFFTVVIKIIFR